MNIDSVMIKRIQNGFNVVTPRNIPPPEGLSMLRMDQQAQAIQAYQQAQQAAANDPVIFYCADIDQLVTYMRTVLVDRDAAKPKLVLPERD